MKRLRLTEAQIEAALRQAESGVQVEGVCRKIGISRQTSYRLKKKSAGLEPLA